jgi:lysophospholipase L1-like esterase
VEKARAVLRSWIWVGAVLGLAACDSSPVAPPPPGLGISCPAAASGVSHLNAPAIVSWDAPSTTGGTAPVTVSCTPAPGTAFNLGSTTVTCLASDARLQAASCSFPVTVTRAPQLGATRFMAFGDSITEGKSQDPPPFGLLSIYNPASYPYKLNNLLKLRFPDQDVTVMNEGLAGEFVADGYNRLASSLAPANPDAVLLLDGANDLLNFPSSTTTQYIAGKLRDMVRLVQSRSAGRTPVLLATFPPQRQGTYKDRSAGLPYVPELNQRIADVARTEKNAYLVDLYAGFPTDTSRLISVDGLHPTPEGYTLMAQIFYQAVLDHFETKLAARHALPIRGMIAGPERRYPR